jgi:hypothetical protein
MNGDSSAVCKCLTVQKRLKIIAHTGFFVELLHEIIVFLD